MRVLSVAFSTDHSCGDASSTPCGSPRSLRGRLTHCNACLAALDDNYIQRESVLTTLELYLADMRVHLTKPTSELGVMRAAVTNFANDQDAGRQEPCILRDRFFKLGARIKAARVIFIDLFDTLPDREHFKLLLRVSVAHV